MWKCPKCESTNLLVNVVVTAKLVQSEKEDLNEGSFETLLDGGDHGWDADSVMLCVPCGFSSPSCEFDTTFVDWPEEEEEEGLRQLGTYEDVGIGEVFINKADGLIYQAAPTPDIYEPCGGCVFMSDGGPIKGCSTSPDCSDVIFVRQP